MVLAAVSVSAMVLTQLFLWMYGCERADREARGLPARALRFLKSNIASAVFWIGAPAPIGSVPPASWCRPGQSVRSCAGEEWATGLFFLVSSAVLSFVVVCLVSEGGAGCGGGTDYKKLVRAREKNAGVGRAAATHAAAEQPSRLPVELTVSLLGGEQLAVHCPDTTLVLP